MIKQFQMATIIRVVIIFTNNVGTAIVLYNKIYKFQNANIIVFYF